MIITAATLNDGPIAFVLSGRFDAHEADGFRAAIDPALKSPEPHVDIDLSDVEFIDSTALAELVRAMKRCREQSGDLRLLTPSNPVQVILELTRLDAAFTIV